MTPIQEKLHARRWKRITLFAILVAVFSLAVTIWSAATWDHYIQQAAWRGYRVGVDHVLTDARYFTVTRYDPDHPEDSAWEGYDQQIFLILDGQTYARGMHQG